MARAGGGAARPNASPAVALLAAATLLSAGCASRPGGTETAASETRRTVVSSPIVARLAGFESRAGLLELHANAPEGKLYAVLPPAAAGGVIGEYLYYEGIVTGLGSNPVGLDRGQIGDPQILRLREVGGRLLFEIVNYGFRALSDDAAERRAVAESFAPSIVGSAEILARDADGRILVDLAPFLLRDAHGIAERLAGAGQGSFSLDRDRSAADIAAALAFPDNVELESILTFSSTAPGDEVRSVAAEPRSVSFRLHQSLVRLPDDGYAPRAFDPRLGSYAIRFHDYASPIAEPIEKRWIVRHRVRKVDPSAPASPAERPIVFYVDRGAPEPIRSALVEGASWWAKAFEEAGFENAFRVEILPEGADPLDVRYHVIQWVHRATRGWSYGGGVIDPRTGEMVKAHVTLGSLRVRQDRLLFEGLLGAEATGTGSEGDPVALSLARIRQLAAHEVGHALGLAHNFAASTYGGRASVMDYPAPLVRVNAAGELDVSRAYAAGVGEWDRHAIRWAYAEFAPGENEAGRLEEIARAGLEKSYYFLSDADARPAGAAHPRASLWDNGEDPAAALDQALRVRRIALSRFGERNLGRGDGGRALPLARLEETLAPVYFYHRFQLAAAAKLLGGVEYRYTVAGDGGLDQARPVSPERQRRALASLLDGAAPENLDLAEDLVRKLLPRPHGYGDNREMFASRTAPLFDAMGAAATAADLAVRALLAPERAARMVDQHRRNPQSPDFAEVLEALVERTFADVTLLEPRLAELARVTQRVVVDRLLELSADGSAAPWVRSRVDTVLADILQRMDRVVPLDGGERAHAASITSEVGRYLARPYEKESAPARTALAEPPGEPIGMIGEAAGGADGGRAARSWLLGDDGCALATLE